MDDEWRLIMSSGGGVYNLRKIVSSSVTDLIDGNWSGDDTEHTTEIERSLDGNGGLFLMERANGSSQILSIPFSQSSGSKHVRYYIKSVTLKYELLVYSI